MASGSTSFRKRPHRESIGLFAELLELASSSDVLPVAKLEELTPTRSKSKLLSPTADLEDLKGWCDLATDSIAYNILISSCKYSFRHQIHDIDKLRAQGTLLSCIALSLLVHASKIGTPEGWDLFISLVDIFSSSSTYRFAFKAEQPDEKTITKALKFVDHPVSRSIIGKNAGIPLEELGAAPFGAEIHFVWVIESRIRAWCVADGICINCFSLKRTRFLDLIEPEPLGILFGHELQHYTVRQQEGDFNVSTPNIKRLRDKVHVLSLTRNGEGLDPTKNCESGLLWELEFVGGKYYFWRRDSLAEALVQHLRQRISEVKDGETLVAIEDLGKFAPIKRAYNSSMPFEAFVIDYIFE